jgi:hypothetical protein
MRQPHHPRRGSVLVIVAGLALLMLTMFLVVVKQVRTEVSDGQLVLRDVQARAMLPAALSYILEAARFGPQFVGEAFGWTDIRDGRPGPVGPRLNGAIPSLGDYGTYADSATVAGTNWPHPGSILRAPMHALVRPPHAVKPIYAYNPMRMPPEWLDEWNDANAADRPKTTIGKVLWPTPDNGDGEIEWGEIQNNRWTSNNTGAGTGDSAPNWFYWAFAEDGVPWQMFYEGTLYPVPSPDGTFMLWSQVYQKLYNPYSTTITAYGPEFHFSLTPQPVADTFADFLTAQTDASGEPAVEPLSLGRGWFRIYRERLTDHDGSGGRQWQDTIKLSSTTGDAGAWPATDGEVRNYSVFIITCGSGGTDGFRDWTEATATLGAAHAAQRFVDQATFNHLRSQERIFWYRCEWSGLTAGGVDMAARMGTSTMGQFMPYYPLGLGGHWRYASQSPANDADGTAMTTTPRMLYANWILQRRPRLTPEVYDDYGAQDSLVYAEYGPRSNVGGTEGHAAYQYYLQGPNASLNNLGTIKWLERLPREPVDEGGNPMW